MDDLIPVTVLCGPQDGLRWRAAAWLARTRAPQARWALLRTGVLLPAPDEAWPAHLARYDAGAACGCCIGQVALRLTLARLLRDGHRLGAWQALMIDAGAAADPRALVAVLDAPPFAGRFALARRIAVLDPAVAAPVLDGPPGPAQARLVAQLGFCDALLAPQSPGRSAEPGAEVPAPCAPASGAGGAVADASCRIRPGAPDGADDASPGRAARVDTALARIRRAAPHLVDLGRFP